jgi:hypothetical protein
MGIQQRDAEMSGFDDYLNAAPAAAAKPSFDQYLGAAPAPAPVQAAPGTPPSPGGQSNPPPLGGFLTGVGDAVKGTTQGIVHGLSWAADKIAPNSQFATDARAALPQMQTAIDQQNAQYAQQRVESGQSGMDWSRLAGNAVGTAPTLAIGPEYAGLGLAGKLGLGAVQGAAGAGMMPTTDLQPGQTYAGQKAEQMGIGAGTGALAPAAFEGAKAIGSGILNTVKPVIQPGKFVGQGIANAMGPTDAALAASNIRSAPQFVPGSLPTTAQAAQTPFMVQTEKAAANIPAFKTAFAQRAIDNNDARWSSLMGVAQTPDALQAATAARAAAVEPLYDAANNQTANVGKAFINFAQRPAVMQAMQQADLMARNEGVNLTWPQQGGSKAISGQALDYTSRALSDMIDSAKRQGNNQQVRALTDAQNYLQGWTQSYIPQVKQARQAYAQLSVPVNTMEAGQGIANSLGTRAMNAGGAPEIQLNPYRTALTQAMSNAKYGIDAGAHQSLQGIGQDLQRATVSNSMRSPGSDTAYNLAANGWLAKNLYGPNFQGATGLGKAVAATGALLTGHPIAAGGIVAGGNQIGQMVGSRLQQHLSNYLLSPESILPYLDARAATPAQSIQNALSQRLLQYGRPAVVNGATSGLINANQ